MFASLLTPSVATSVAMAHPSHDIAQEAAKRADFLSYKPRSVSSCSSELERRGHTGAALAQRSAFATRAQQMQLTGKPLVRRDFGEYDTIHAANFNVAFGSDGRSLLSESSSCLLQSEVTEGPFYVGGELLR